MLVDCFIVDIDGTLADCEHRRHWLQTQPKNWGAFLKACSLGTPIEPVIKVVQALSYIGYPIILCSGRGSEYAQETRDWLEKYQVPYTKLIMRDKQDFRSDSVVKKEMLDLIKKDCNIVAVFDDRPKVVQMWKDNGVFVLNVQQEDRDF